LLLIVAANCIFVAWLFNALRELARRGVHTQYSPHWAITGYLVPFLNFVMPYMVLRDVWRTTTVTQPQEKARVMPTPPRIKFWWVLTLIVIVLITLAGNAMSSGLQQLTSMAVAAYIGSAAVLALSIAVIALVEGELVRMRSGGAARVKLFGRFPLPAVASVSVVLAAALMTLGFYGYAQNKIVIPPPPPAPPSEEVNQQTNPPGIAGGIPGGVSEKITGGVVGTSVPPPKSSVQRIRVSGSVQAGLLEKSVPPVYPPLAKQARVQGKVTLQSIISRDGKVTHLEVVYGHPLLRQAAMDAVKQWEYKPFLLNGEPVEVETTVDVVFSLN
jgi:TonB family protein